MTPDEVCRWPEKGQYWASTRPLALIRMGECKAEDTGVAVRWTPETAEEEVCFVLPFSPGEFRFLWHESRSTYHSSLTFVVGDVWVYVNRIGQNRLFFIGPETTKESVHLIADHFLQFTLPQNPKPPENNISFNIGGDLNMMTYTPDMQLFQPGPARKTPPPKSVWDAISREEP